MSNRILDVQHLTDNLIASKGPIRTAQIVIDELFTSTVTPNRSLLG